MVGVVGELANVGPVGVQHSPVSVHHEDLHVPVLVVGEKDGAIRVLAVATGLPWIRLTVRWMKVTISARLTVPSRVKDGLTDPANHSVRDRPADLLVRPVPNRNIIKHVGS